MEKVYFSVDVEASGRDWQRYSLLSIGACLVGKRGETFYEEMQSLDDAYDERALRIGCLGLKSLTEIGETNRAYNPRYEAFQPKQVLQHLRCYSKEPPTVMTAFREWVLATAEGKAPIFVSSPLTFDYPFVKRYFSLFSIANPFQEGQDMRTVYEDLIASRDLSIDQLGLDPKELDPSHNALEDALLQARVFEKLLDFAGREKR